MTLSNKTIAKFCAFVILIGLAGGFFQACSAPALDAGHPPAKSRFGSPQIIGIIKSPEITESSGIAASRCQNEVLWTHNDSGDDAFIFAINRSGFSLGTWKVPNARTIDWEDIVALNDKDGRCFLYLGDIGDNKRGRAEHTIYRVKEPVVRPSDQKSSRKDPLFTDYADSLRFSYPDYLQDAETLMVHPATGDIYVVTKRISGPAGIYRLRPLFDLGTVVKIEKVAEISVPAIPDGFLTGGDTSPDGRHVIICDYAQAYEYVLPDAAVSFDEIWRQDPEPVSLGKRAAGEGVSYSLDGTSIFATSEGKNSPLIEVNIRK